MAAVARERPGGLAFAALKHLDFRFYVTGATLSMMADNIEHVITYWVMWQMFHSPMLAGFAVISHWVPYLFAIYFGALADRYDCRRIIQVSQGLFMLVSISWGVLFLAGRLEMWQAMLLLTLHGFAGAIWSPAEQLMLHDIVGQEHLESAVRLNSTGRMLGILLGPAVGGLILLLAGPAHGIFINALIYLPLSLSLLRIASNGHRHGASARKVSLGDAWVAVVEAASNRAVLSMIVGAGLAALFIGSFQPQMPEFARDIDAGNAGLAYTVLLLASGAGAVIGGLALEVTGAARITVGTAIGAAAIWGVTTAGFAVTHNLAAAVIFLLLGGAAQLAFNSIAQTIVQLQAPAELRGRLIGAFMMAQLGFKAGSGVSVGVVGGAVGIHAALGWSAAVTVAVTAAMFALTRLSPVQKLAYADLPEGWRSENTPPCC
ncbi:MAG: MFS transporter [Chloroflexota bacterium]|nr:MFS transporter [Chloroflexota bacterium]